MQDVVKKGILSIMGSGITLVNNEIKAVLKVIKFLWKRTTRKIIS